MKLILRYILCLFAFILSFIAEGKPKYAFTPINREFDNIANQLLEKEFYFRSQPDAEAAVAQMQKIARLSRNNQLIARGIFWEVRTNQLVGKPELQIAKLLKARKLSSADYEYDNAFINYQLAGNYQRLGKYFTTYQLLQKSIPVFERFGDRYSLGNSWLLMALTYWEIGEIEQAISCIDKAQQYYKEVGFPLNRIHYFRAMMHSNENTSLKFYKMSVNEGQHEPPMSVQALISISKLFLNQNKLDSAQYYVDKAHRLIEGPLKRNDFFRVMLLYQQAEIALNKKQYSEVIQITDDINSVMKHYPGEHLTHDLYKFRSESYEAMGNFTAAFEALKQHQRMQNEYLATMHAREIPKAREREAISRQKQLISEVRRQEQQHRYNLYILMLALGIITIASTGLLIFFYQRAKIRKIKNRELRSNLEQQMAIARFNRENFNKEMQRKACEISTSVLLLSNKNDVLQRIGDITREYADSGRIPRDYVDCINETVGTSIKNDNEWSRFKLHFEGVHPGFFVSLKEHSNDLTENELRLCAYLRIGMRAKEIAGMLAVSAASINTARYRIRKKLGLSKDDSLDDFIRKI